MLSSSACQPSEVVAADNRTDENPSCNCIEVPWELHGARFGYLASTVAVSKVNATSSMVLASNATRFRVAQDVLIVPIQAILVLPNYSNPDYEAVMRAKFNAEKQGVLWDDGGVPSDSASSVPAVL